MENPATYKTHAPLRKTSRFRLITSVLIILLSVAAVGTYAWYSLYNPCDVDAVQEASAFLVSQMKRYDDVYISTAAAPSRIAIAYPLTVMEQILMDTKQVEVPVCMRTAKNELIGYMGNAIRAFQAFGAREADATIKSLLDDSYAHVRNFIKELEVVAKCAPYCLP